MFCFVFQFFEKCKGFIVDTDAEDWLIKIGVPKKDTKSIVSLENKETYECALEPEKPSKEEIDTTMKSPVKLNDGRSNCITVLTHNSSLHQQVGLELGPL